jgi:hypothetical protein
MDEEWEDFCTTCGGGTIHIKRTVKYGGISTTCKECKTETIVIEHDDGKEEVSDDSN